MSTVATPAIRWERGTFFPLKHAFYRAIYGDLESHLFKAAEQGNTVAAWSWLVRGADIHAENDRALRLAYQNNRDNTVTMLLKFGADRRTLQSGGSLDLRPR